MKRRRKPTYGAATRLARLVYELGSHPFGWSFEAIQRELQVSERTLLRYIAACRKELVDWHGRPLLQVVQHGSRRKLKLADFTESPDSNAYQTVFLYFMLTVLRFLEGTVIQQGVEELWERTFKSLGEKQRAHLVDFDKKFFAVSYVPKDYRKHDDQLDWIARALIHQYRVRIDYAGLLGEGKIHDFDPYTLAAYRSGLYVIGYSHLYDKIIWLAVERIRKVERVIGDDKQPLRFAYPRDYRPEKQTDGMFGIFEGEETEVKLLLRNPETEALLRARTIHPTQRFDRRRDGRVVLTIKVRGTEELKNWILSMGPWVEVLKPVDLRRQIARLLLDGHRLYSRRATSLREHQ